jgi:hypothetical protein
VPQLEGGVAWDTILEQMELLPHMLDTYISALMAFMEAHNIKLHLCDEKKWHLYSFNCEQDTPFIKDEIL